MLRARRSLLFGMLTAAVAAFAIAAQVSAAPLLRDGDRMVFLGDSITQQSGYTRYVMDYFALRYPNLRVSFRNAGVSGDTAAGALKRLDKDVLTFHPNVVSISFGMNDAGYKAFDEATYAKFISDTELLVSRLQAAGAKVVLLTPGCVDPDREEEAWYQASIYNPVLARYAEGIVDLGSSKDLPFYDVYSVMLDVQKRAKAKDPEFTMIPDSVHPDAKGQVVMAYGLLKALGCDAQASGLEIDAAARAVKPARCTVEELRVSDGEVRFIRTDDALPTYFAPDVSAVFEFMPIVEDIDDYQFRVTGLKPGTWRLTVAGTEVGSYSADALAGGVNLALAPGPWSDLAKLVNDSVAQREGFCLWERRITGFVHCPPSVDLPPEVEPERTALARKLDKVIDARERETRQLVANRRWEWSLTLQQ